MKSVGSDSANFKMVHSKSKRELREVSPVGEVLITMYLSVCFDAVRRYFAVPTASAFARGGKGTKAPLRNQGFLEFPFSPRGAAFYFRRTEVWTVSSSCAAAADSLQMEKYVALDDAARLPRWGRSGEIFLSHIIRCCHFVVNLVFDNKMVL